MAGVRTLQEHLRLRQWGIGVFATVFASFAAIALLLASVGLYAVTAHGVSQRTQEIGVRVAMGATGRNILSLVFTQGMQQLLAGLLVGLAAAFALTRLLHALLIVLAPADVWTFVIIAAVLIFAGMLSCTIPARRAMRVDPVVALRCE